MPLRVIALAPVLLVALTACDSGRAVTPDTVPSAPVPTAVSCADAPQLRQRAADDRRRSGETKSDHERIVFGNRASFFASLAIVADLKCRVTLEEADDALKPALEAAGRAEATGSMYERAAEWSRANFIASEVITLLIGHLPPPAPK